jgi:predicted transcriptional regulator
MTETLKKWADQFNINIEAVVKEMENYAALALV